MELNYFIISCTVINFALLVAIAIVGYTKEYKVLKNLLTEIKR